MNHISSKKVLLTSFLVDFSDIILNIIVSILSGSTIALTEALQGTTDLLTSGSLIIGYSNSKRKASGSFQFGFGKEIYFWSLISAFLMLFLTGFLSIYFGYERLLNPQKIENILLVFAVLIIALCTNFYAFLLSFNRLKKNSGLRKIWHSFVTSTLIEIKTAFVMDLMGAVAAFLGLINLIIYVLTGNAKFDGIGAICIGVIVILFSIFIIFEIRKFITGRSADSKTIEEIKNNILLFPQVHEVSDLRTMYLGSEKLVINVDIELDRKMHVSEAVDITEAIKTKLKENIENVGFIRIELED